METANPDTSRAGWCPARNRKARQPVMELGKFYRVRCLRADWIKSNVPKWTPIIGTLHDDREFIGFEQQHFHVDFRFLGKPARTAAAAHQHGARKINLTFALPITHVIPLGTKRYISLEGSELRKFPEESYMKTMRLKFKTDYPEYDFEPPWLRSMEEAYQDASLGPAMICPHQGTDLNGIKPDEDEFLTCPLHGLRWNSLTGKLAPKSIRGRQTQSTQPRA